MENAGYIFAAFSVIWLVVFGYLLLLSSRQKRLKREIESLEETFKESSAKQ
ncbi:CcmD family protein [Chloroflexota bacterium]